MGIKGKVLANLFLGAWMRPFVEMFTLADAFWLCWVESEVIYLFSLLRARCRKGHKCPFFSQQISALQDKILIVL